MENKKKVAVYCRVSDTDQHPENQAIALKKYCELNALEFDYFQEKESTRKTRPVKQELITKLREGIYEKLIVYKLDRWGRSLPELVMDMKELIDRGIVFISVTENIDLSNAAGQLMYNLLACFADYERSLIRERTLLGLARVRNEGKQLGRPKGAKDKRQRSNEGYIRRMKINPPSNNVHSKSV